MADGRYREAAVLVCPLFEHPQWSQVDAITVSVARCNLAASLMYAGSEEEAAVLFRSVMTDPNRTMARSGLLVTRAHLLGRCAQRPTGEKASEVVTDLAEEVVRRMRRRKKVSARPAERATFGELEELLSSV